MKKKTKIIKLEQGKNYYLINNMTIEIILYITDNPLNNMHIFANLMDKIAYEEAPTQIGVNIFTTEKEALKAFKTQVESSLIIINKNLNK